jgi:tetratricopeptide (TPR) repeat protein
MVGEITLQLPTRKKYVVKDVMNDLKKIGPSPSILSEIGSKLVYYEWSCCKNILGIDHPITMHFNETLDFMEHGFEQSLVEGELHRAKDTPQAAINDFLKGRPDEFLNHTLERPVEYIRNLLESIVSARQEELKYYTQMESVVRQEIEVDSKNPELWNKLRLLLWITGKYNEASEAFKAAISLGWTKETSAIVAL